MRRIPKFQSITCVLTLLLSGWMASAASVPTTAAAAGGKHDEALKAVEALLTQSHAADANGERSDLRTTSTYLGQVKAALAKKDLFTARDAAQNASRSLQTPEFQIAWSQLLAQLNKDCDEFRSGFPDLAKAALDSARSKCLAAKGEDELEGVDEELQELAAQASHVTATGERFVGMRDSLFARLQNAAQAVRTWRDMLAAQTAGNTQQALNNLANLENNQSRLFTPTAIAKVREAINDSANAVVDRRIAALAEAVAKAGSLEDCQKALDKFNKEPRGGISYNSYNGMSGDFTRVQRASQTVQTWINVSSAKAAGRPRQALSLLGQDVRLNPGVVANTNLDYTVIPQKTWTDLRTELTQMVAEESKVIREPELKQFVELVDKAQSLDALVDAARKSPLEPGRMSYGYPGAGFAQSSQFDNQSVVSEIAALAQDVNTLGAMREDLANSRFRNILMSWAAPANARTVTGTTANVSVTVTTIRSGTHRWKERTQALKQDMLLQALARFSQIPDLKAEANESPDQMLLRIADTAFKARDYRKVLLALDAYRITFYGTETTPEWLASDLRGCAAYLAALNYEAAEVPLAAAKCYMTVLGETGSHVPTKEAGERLRILRQKFPEAVSAAASQPSVPPVSPNVASPMPGATTPVAPPTTQPG
jgi:hypothetical protein